MPDKIRIQTNGRRRCKATVCDHQVPIDQLICAQHAGRLPKHVRNELFTAFNKGAGEHSPRFNAAFHAAKQYWS